MNVPKPPSDGSEQIIADYSRAQMTSALVWSSGGQVIMQILTVGGGVILARLLLPLDYGVFAASTILVTLTTMFAGLGVQTIILREANPSRRFLSALSGMNLTVASATTLCILALREQIAKLTGVSEIAYTLPLHVLVILFTAYTIVPQALLICRMEQQKIAKVGIVGTLGYLVVALALASLGMGYWAFISASVVQAGISMLLMWKLNGYWFPPHYSTSTFQSELLFGLQLGLNNVLVWASGLIDNLLVGRILGAASLGYYVFGYNLARMPQRNIVQSIASVTEALIAESVRQKHDILRRYLRLLRYLTLFVFFAQSVLFSITPYLIPFVYGDKWNISIVTMQIITLGTMIISVSSLSHQIYSLMGRPAVWTNILIIRILLIVILVPILSIYGIEGIGWAVSIAFFASVLMDQFQLVHLLNGSFVEIRRSVTPASLCAVSTIGVALVTHHLLIRLPNNFLRILAATIISLVTFTGTLSLFFPEDRKFTIALFKPIFFNLQKHTIGRFFSRPIKTL